MGTTPLGINYPEASDPPDGSSQMRTLAEDVDAVITRQRVAAEQVNASFDANGHYTWTHNLGWAPDAVTAVAEVAQSFTSPLTIMVRSDSDLTDRVIFKAYTAAGDPVAQPVTLHVIAVGTWPS